MRDGEVPVASDERLDFLRDFILKALRLKPDKWDRMFISDEQRSFITNKDSKVLITNVWPTTFCRSDKST